MDNIKTGSFIREKRKEKGFTQKDIAERLNVTDRAISKWERGLCAPDIALLEPLSKILEVSISDLISGEESQAENKKNEKIIVETINYSNREMTIKTKRLKKELIIISLVAGLVVLTFLVYGFSSVILSFAFSG